MAESADQPKQAPTTDEENDETLLVTEDFSEDYANNVYFQLSSWDLRILFGEFNQLHNPPAVEFHTAITIPWTQAKIMSYLLQVQIAYYEAVNGTIKLPSGTVPSPMQLAPDWAANPKLTAVHELAQKLHRKLVEDMAQA